MWNGNSYLSGATPSLLLRTRVAFQLHRWHPRAKITFPNLPHVRCDPVPKCWPKRNAPKDMCNSWGLPLKGRSVPSPSFSLAGMHMCWAAMLVQVDLRQHQCIRKEVRQKELTHMTRSHYLGQMSCLCTGNDIREKDFSTVFKPLCHFGSALEQLHSYSH